MTVKELNYEERLQLKEELYYGSEKVFELTEQQQKIIKQSLTSDSIPDDLVDEIYAGINFTKDDFWCNIDNKFYYDIHVNYGHKDGDGYSIFIICDEQDDEKAINKAIEEERFEYPDDVYDVDYVCLISKQEYSEATGKEVK